MSDFKIDDFEILGTEAFHDFDKRGFDDLSQGDSFGDRKDFSSTKDMHCDFRHVGVAYQISGFGSINMKEESFRAHLEIKYVYRIDASDAEKYRKLKACPLEGGFQGMFDKGDLKFSPPIVTCRNAIVEAAPIREQVTSVDLMRPQHGPDGYFVTLTGEYRMQCHETIRHEKSPSAGRRCRCDSCVSSPWPKSCSRRTALSRRCGSSRKRTRLHSVSMGRQVRSNILSHSSQPPACIVGK